MPQPVVAGAELTCSFGAAPTALIVLPKARVFIEQRPAATIMDHLPLINIPTFGLCTSPANPAVAAATAAAMGVLTPAPCVPLTEAPWLPGAPTVLIGGVPALDNVSVCVCASGGCINVALAGTVHTVVP
ncbi:DUF4280 domain-containing protein [Trinickia dabaoshanensis]|uniref:DUF4280 domain-containing protein n=1 Tax=Trinickia dabaoshanensis TaxID=564714 RepID=A0A2N7VTG6_9BURK|nr:DUF4280 domain-containing protein [Trinickia dabaoshanensis]PMS20434.1 DUF4280 domain-containing protein [Trinickia dabaoshanensis]